MKNYKMIINKQAYYLTAENDRKAMKMSGTFGINADYGVTSLIREDGKVVIWENIYS